MAKKVRERCVERDDYCRLIGLSPCAGPSQCMHLGEKKRARTRGMKPEQRHTTAGSMMGCERHHALYDAGQIEIAMDERGADGPIRASYYAAVLMC